jgi:Family of unknown function (DUF6011)
MSKYRWVRHEGERLFDGGILPDGTLRNPRGYPEDIVRSAVTAADARRHERRTAAASKAAVTRKRRHAKRVSEIVERLELGHRYGPSGRCVICRKKLSDPESISRGIGSDCWQDILRCLA